ncbi:hypothetical protein DN748_15740 [Sinomicrobium soli]|nr:hypothetical protein DN748_15740 [Sinomicrobium sp. N-1-3-6]
MPLAAQEFPYEKKWKEIEKKEAEGLLKSALPGVNEIYEAAGKDGNVTQRIRALLYRSRIAVLTSDDDGIQQEVIRDFEGELSEAEGAEKSLLESMLAETIYSYYRNNRWTIDRRTRMEEASTEDFRFWSENIFDDRVTALYLGSLENAEILRQQPAAQWQEILEPGPDAQAGEDRKGKDAGLERGRELRPAMYDLIAHRAIDFFRDQPDVFFNTFGKDADAERKKDKALALLRELEEFHRANGNTNARLYNALEALKLRRQEYGDDEYAGALEKLSRIAPGSWYSGEVLLELARFYNEQAGEEEAGDFEVKKAWCDKALALTGTIASDYKGTSAAVAARQLERQIRAEEFSVQLESYIPSGQANPMSVTHKNLGRIYFRILRFRPDPEDYFEDPLQEIRYAKEEDRQQLLEALFRRYPLEKEFTLELKTFDDYQAHTTTAALETLPEGRYIILATNAADFNMGKEGAVLQSQQIDVTPYAVVGNGRELLVTERRSGHPQPGKTIEVYERDGERLKPVKTVTTDASGKADIRYSGQRYHRYYYRIKGEDVFYDLYGYRGDTNREKEISYTARFFTDRSIYRPGQTVYFKAVYYRETPDGKTEAVPGEALDVELKDPNNRTVGTLKLTTNTFGSASGEFVLPTGGLTGMFRLECDWAEVYSFSVEEYKRPRFEVVFDTVKKTFRLGEEIRATAKAQAYSGADIDGAKVVYRVYRQAVYPYLPWWRRADIHPEPREEITYGETTTDAAGNFEVPFEARPPSSLLSGKKAETPRTYTYTVEADITDINGETRSGSQSITVGDLRYTLYLDMPARVAWEDLEKIGLRTENLNGQFMPAKGELTLTKIVPPERVLREVSLPAGDYELYGREEFVNLFPNDPYDQEDKKENWKEETPVISTGFDTGKEKEIAVKPRKGWKEGYYLLRGYIRDGKDSIPSEQLVYLYKREKKQPVDRELFAVTTDKDRYTPGETARVTFASSAPDAVVTAELEYDGKVIKREVLKINKGVKTFAFPVEEDYRGNVFVHYYFGKYNTARQGVQTIAVPLAENTLEITAGTMRDKLQPGDEESWELTVSGKGKDAFLAGLATGGAEVLATMYDASLDQFKPHDIQWTPRNSMLRHPDYGYWDIHRAYRSASLAQVLYRPFPLPETGVQPVFDRINWFGFDINGRNRGNVVIRGVSTSGTLRMAAQKNTEVQEYAMMEDSAALEEMVTEMQAEPASPPSPDDTETGLSAVQPRRALQETAFFFPHLKTDEEGNVKLRFTTPESLTEWKFMALAHTPGLYTVNYEASVRTRKELMIVPNPPRFLREGDVVEFRAKVTNLSGKDLSGKAQLLLFDAFTMQPVDTAFENGNNERDFNAAEGQSDNVSWTLRVPSGQQAIVYRVVASAGNYSDGEESALPVLTNRMLVTETLPLHIREGQEQRFELDKLAGTNSATRENFRLTFEMTTNPVWYAVFSLPYLREFPYECSEQVFSRLYGNLVSQQLVNSNPRIKAVFDDWNRNGQLQSRLELNEELKSLLLEETPWVRQAAGEEEQMKRIAVLFDLNNMRNELGDTFRKLQGKQLSSGAFPWFDGGAPNRNITTHIVSGFGHLQAMGIGYENTDIRPDDMIGKAIGFIDGEMEAEWDRYQKNEKYPPSLYNGVSWMYARSYFLESYPLSGKGKAVADYFLDKLDKEKFTGSRYHQAMLSLVFHRFGKNGPAEKLLRSVKDQSVVSDEMGMYWKDNRPGWYWYNAPIETQALLIEAFDEVLQDTGSVELMKVWLLKNRQTNRWVSTKATTEAVFVLMSTGKDWVNSEGGLAVSIGGDSLDIEKMEEAQQGSGYVKTAWKGKEITPEMGTVDIKKTSPGVAWGALYWQYFEDLDQITSAATGIRFKKELFLKKLTDQGPELQRITEKTPIQVGDLVTVRLEIKNDRDMEFVHIKDMRASGFEPVNVLSGYRWQGGLGYYESTRDAATNFFADRMPKGVYVFEYDLRAGNSGDFSNGITSLQCMYAPEMSAHSEGIRVNIE